MLCSAGWRNVFQYHRAISSLSFIVALLTIYRSFKYIHLKEQFSNSRSPNAFFNLFSQHIALPTGPENRATVAWLCEENKASYALCSLRRRGTLRRQKLYCLSCYAFDRSDINWLHTWLMLVTLTDLTDGITSYAYA